MDVPAKLFLGLGAAAFGLAIVSFFVRVALGTSIAIPFFLSAFGAAVLAFALAVLVKLGVLGLDVPGESER